MKNIIAIIVLISIFGDVIAHGNHIDEKNQSIQELKQEAAFIIKQFGSALKKELKRAIKSKGAVHAVEVCNYVAPDITQDMSIRNLEWQISRVSLKNRNLDATPNSWEAEVLKDFDKKAKNGANLKKLTYAKIVGDEFRFMKAQPVESICLVCHGKNIKASIKKAIKAKYPFDKATGYSLGEVRGAFSLVKRLP